MVCYLPKVALQPWAAGCSHVVAQKLTCSQKTPIWRSLRNLSRTRAELATLRDFALSSFLKFFARQMPESLGRTRVLAALEFSDSAPARDGRWLPRNTVKN